ncbi:hypothetical protein BO70DRAFT_367154 [Aspergillus heteromorphus CBS 117.55]|uniref:Uncharacterized protein n=1 Tax=Aspergillus heteromorphus CBS 117.55 TaxID=1448321 RepID=A0A317UQM9_9EURO|nr:uncharacterized protein BO70DRAFT_367154 [Aspergillus heteromorphus CBS 117.55]PWY63556.1 hypothetical protein BO70DRAFT_367154 [Aspergillus heteromorphus CBS 117.55]
MSHQSVTSGKRARRFIPELIETSTRSFNDHRWDPSSPENPSQTQSRPISNLPPDSLAVPWIEPGKYALSPHNRALSNDPDPRKLVIHDPTLAKPQLGRKPSSKVVSTRESVQTIFEGYAPNDQRNTALSGPRKFTPQLVETGKHSFRRQGKQPTPPKERTQEKLAQVSCNHNIVGDSSTHVFTSALAESRFSYTSLRQRQETKRHSFRVPELPAIPSSSSDASDISRSSSQPASPPVPLREPVLELEATQVHRQTEYSEYVLALAAHSAESQLKEQALAAFPNEQVYQPVDHFAIDREEDCSNEDELSIRTKVPLSYIYRRASSADLHWELDYMRRHKEEAEMCDRAMAGTKAPHFSPTACRTSGRAGQTDHVHESWVPGSGSPQVKQFLSPPMLGCDLLFPQSLSPNTTVCEGSNVEHLYTHNAFHQSPGLWYSNHHLNDDYSDGGLWMGTCKSDMNDFKSEGPRSKGSCPEDTGGGSRSSSRSFLTKCKSRPFNFYGDSERPKHTESQSSCEEVPDYELTDGFVTQIYNYLSLGYPSVARYYDHELSRVSGIALQDLRHDDLQTDAKGYVSLSEECLKDRTVVINGCMRWLALRLYIQEWAQKRPIITAVDSDHGTWGVCERKGSWAV